MTRQSIEACAKVFIVVLSLTFIWAVYTVLHIMGLA
jgi:hypothetical protein